MSYINLLVIICFIFVMFLSCSDPKKDNNLAICEKDTTWKETEVTNSPKNIGKIHVDENPEVLKKRQRDSIAKQEEAFRLEMLEMKQVNEFKKTIYSRSIDLNFDKKKDLLIIYIIVSEGDTITYLSVYTHLESQMKNTFDYRFEEKIDKIIDVRTFNDSTISINAVLANQKKSIQKKFKYINDNYFFLMN